MKRKTKNLEDPVVDAGMFFTLFGVILMLDYTNLSHILVGIISTAIGLYLITLRVYPKHAKRILEFILEKLDFLFKMITDVILRKD